MKKFYFAFFFTLIFFSVNAQQQPFITTWEVTSSDLSITIPTQGTGYNYTVDFGDGTVQNNVTGDVSHTYSAAGTFTVSISGTFPRICFGCSSNLSLIYKIKTIEQWGDIQWQSMESAFEGCIYLNVWAIDDPGLNQVTNMSNMFKNAGDILQYLNNWDVSNVTDMSGMFQGIDYFVQPINNWNVSNVTDMSYMFAETSYNQPLDNWDVSSVTNMSYMFYDNYAFNHPLNSWDVSNVTDMSYMFFYKNNFNQPLDNWDVSNVSDMSYMFNECQVFNQSLNSWNVSNVTNMEGMFSFAGDFNQPLNNWDVSNVANMSQMFEWALDFNQNIHTWDVSSVTNMSGMFALTNNFDQPLNNWDVSSVTNMSGMFVDAYLFNQPLNNWDVSNVIDMSAMFGLTGNFNQPLNNWDVSNVTNMSEMFSGASAFNQPLNNWDVSSVTNMSKMFSGAFFDVSIYNQPLDNWDVSNVTDMSYMFESTPFFNQSIGNWDVSNVTNMSHMFARTLAFDQVLNNWDVSNVTNMDGMFIEASVFNQPVDNWDVSGVISMRDMFRDAPVFNQPLDNWDVSNIIYMSGMFVNASTFNQNLSNWNFNQSVSFNGWNEQKFISNSGLDVNNYDALLSHLASLDLAENELGADGLEYCNEAARNELINTGWTIYGDNLSPDCNMVIGNILYDENNNGCDPSDMGVSGFMINVNDGIYDFTTFSNNGSYSASTNGTSFTVSILNTPSYYTVTPPSATVTFTTSDTEQQDFCVTANQSIDDLNVTLLPISQARPGFEADYQLVVQNMGTQSVPNASVTLNFDDSKQSFVSAVPSPISTTANQLTFNLANLLPFETRTIDFTMQTFTPPTVNGGDVLSFTAAVAPNANDHTPADNTFVYDQTVVNSFDPNDKQVLQGEEIFISEADEYLNYLIRFQNTGTASAINVRILDTLHPKLDWNTIQPVSSSHNYRVEITDGNHVEFIFENINLPYEAIDEPGSHGFIAYKIKPKSDVTIGDVITGDARIYFDFNAPIITNMVSTEIVENLSAENFELASNIRLYPNPTNGILNISSETKLEKVELFSITGNRLLLQENSLEKIDLHRFSEGIYFLKIIGDNGAEVVEKIVKK